MLNKKRVLPGVVAVASMFALGGCATVKHANQVDIPIERIDSSTVKISHAYITQTPKGLMLKGDVKRKRHSHNRIPGHLHVELVSMDGEVLQTIEIDHARKGSSDHLEDFQILLPSELTADSIVRVVHHDAKSHEAKETTSVWLEAEE